MSDMATSPRHGQRPRGWHALKWLIITATALLSPIFFLVMFLTVTSLLSPWRWAWTVPVASEGCFVIAYLLGILLEWAGKPMNWLRLVPWFFAAASLVLNVWASLGDVPGLLAHAVVTVAFFLPLIAGESAVRSLSRSEEDIKLTAESADARRYALDLVRDRKGLLWRFRVPSLLRTQILHRRPPAAVVDAVRDGAQFGGAARWEAVIESWVAAGLTQGDKMAATVARQRREIHAAEKAAAPAAPKRHPKRQPKRQAAATEWRGKAAGIVASDSGIRAAELALQCGISKRTAERYLADVPQQLRVARG